MMLSGDGIKNAINDGQIVIQPFSEKNIGSNSYDVHLSKHIAVYSSIELDARKSTPLQRYVIPDEGMVLLPGILYLASTVEYTETHAHVPFLEGKSSAGRLGISVHATAGKGDVGFCNWWTLELSVVQPVRVYAGMPIAQLIYFEVTDCNRSYTMKKGAKYVEKSPLPVGSMMWKNEF
jgi:dCTP deaminase